MLILGVDPGSIVTGYGLIRVLNNQPIYVACGCIRAKAKSFNQRIVQIHQGLLEIAQRYRPDYGVVEQVFVQKNVQSALKLGHARGAAIIALMSVLDEVAEYTPREIKQAIVGIGGARKEQVQYMVKACLSLSAKPSEDAADALAVAICHANRLKYDASVAKVVS